MYFKELDRIRFKKMYDRAVREPQKYKIFDGLNFLQKEFLEKKNIDVYYYLGNEKLLREQHYPEEGIKKLMSSIVRIDGLDQSDLNELIELGRQPKAGPTELLESGNQQCKEENKECSVNKGLI